LSQRVCGFATREFHLCPSLCKFATRVNDTDGKFAVGVKFAAGVKFSAVVNDTSGNLPLVSMTSVSATTLVVHLELRIFPQIFYKISNGPNGILTRLGIGTAI
jgi:hypothetical protein